MTAVYSELGIKAIQYQIHDFNESDLTAKLPGGAELLDKLLTDGEKVYVHCTAGMGRAPALVLAYLCRYKGYEVSEADLFVKGFRKVSVPNLRAVSNAINHK